MRCCCSRVTLAHHLHCRCLLLGSDSCLAVISRCGRVCVNYQSRACTACLLQVALQDAAGLMSFVANLLDSPKYADATLLAIAPPCEGSAQHPFRCHRAILAARSPYFDAVFSSGALALLSCTIPCKQPFSDSQSLVLPLPQA